MDDADDGMALLAVGLDASAWLLLANLPLLSPASTAAGGRTVAMLECKKKM